MMDRADVTTSEKFRKVMEAYQIEEGFSRSIESYKASLDRNGETLTYDFLRIGRTALLYQSPDGGETGMWNQTTRQWETLPQSYRIAVQQGLRIAKKQAPPALIKLPVFAGEDK
ncbi:TonB system biopolymer transport component [Photobacterium aphoticum]|nr:TonB system biopolymer transport component [Photobacterium aphoticum]